MGLFNLHFVALCGLLLTTSATATFGPDSHGICYTYTTQAGDNCTSIAAAHGLTVADIEKYNTNTFAWNGCNVKSTHYQGTFLCLGPGEPPMPVALPQATCGPQVPGTIRPKSWSELTGLNPCAASECCTLGGRCETGWNCESPDYCIHNCEAGATGTVPAPISTRSSKTSSHTSTKTKATTLSTSTKSKSTKATSTKKTEIETVTKTKATTEWHTISETKIVPPPQPTPKWSLSIYDGYHCDGNYYTIEGTSATGSSCISIQNGHLSTSSNNDLWCRYYTDGGFNSTSCDGGPTFDVFSWILHGGTCLVYSHDCGDDSPGGLSQSWNAWPQCQEIPQVSVDLAMEWRSLRCTAIDNISIA